MTARPGRCMAKASGWWILLMSLATWTFSDASSRTIELSLSEGTAISVDISPRDGLIVFDLLGDLYLLPHEGGGARQLTRGIAVDHSPRFSPDGRSIAFASDRSGIENIWIVGVDGGGLRRLTREEDEAIASRHIGAPAWSPDGRSIIADRQPVGPGPRELWQYDAARGTGRRLATAPLLGTGSFHPTERLVYFSASDDAGGNPSSFRIRRLDLRTGQSSDLGLVGLRPIASPDGRRLAYVAISATGGRELRVLELSGGTSGRVAALSPVRLLTPAFPLIPGYAFTPDSHAIVISSGGRIWRIQPDSGDGAEIPFLATARVMASPLRHHRNRLSDGAFQVIDLGAIELSADRRAVAYSAVGRIWLADPARPAQPRALTATGERAFD